MRSARESSRRAAPSISQPAIARSHSGARGRYFKMTFGFSDHCFATSGKVVAVIELEQTFLATRSMGCSFI